MHKKSKALLKGLCLVNLCFMLALACWQLHRAHIKYILANTKSTHIHHEKELIHTSSIKDKDSIDYHIPINSTAYFIIEPAFYHHQVGQEILVSSPHPDLNQTILIHLGWFDKHTDPQKIIEQHRHKKISGILYTPKGRLLLKTQAQKNWPKKIGFIDMPYISSSLQQPLYEKIIVMPNSALHENLTQPNTLPLGIFRHICYALQFVIFGILGIYFQRKLDKANIHAQQPQKKHK